MGGGAGGTRRSGVAAAVLCAGALWTGAAAFGLASAQEDGAQQDAAQETGSEETGSEETGAEVWDDPRPPVAAYVIVDAAGVEAPLAGASGDAARGRALFADVETGGCISCHAAPGLERVAVAPRILRDRVEPSPPPPASPRVAEAPESQEPEEPAASDSDSRLAPREALVAASRPTDLTAEEAGPGPEEPEVDVAGAPSDEGAVGPPPPVYPGEDEPDRPRLLPLPVGPDLDGVASRLSEAALRLWVIDPRAFGAGHLMPGYHAVSEALGMRRPGLRQPWFSPAQVEDMVAYLATLAEE